jgi:hypothetical protein
MVGLPRALLLAEKNPNRIVTDGVHIRKRNFTVFIFVVRAARTTKTDFPRFCRLAVSRRRAQGI